MRSVPGVLLDVHLESPLCTRAWLAGGLSSTREMALHMFCRVMYWLAAASSSLGSRDKSTLLYGCFDAKRLFGLGPTVHSGVTRSAERLLVEEACTPIHVLRTGHRNWSRPAGRVSVLSTWLTVNGGGLFHRQSFHTNFSRRNAQQASKQVSKQASAGQHVSVDVSVLGTLLSFSVHSFPIRWLLEYSVMLV